MGGKRNLVLGRCAALLFLCGALASLPTNLILGADSLPWAVDVLALVSAAITWVIPWHRIHRHWLHVLGATATAEVVLVVVVHAEHAIVFEWYFVLTATFAAFAFRRRREAVAQVGITVIGMICAAVYAAPVEPDALANAIVGVPTVCVAAGVVIWLRENLERRERTDPLTELANRRALMEALEEVFDQRQVRLLVLFDLDGFKRYNDRLGHAAGDELLSRLGARLNAAVDGHGYAFRLGGDELCVLLDDDTVLPACELALRADGVGASHGLAWLPAEADTPSAALSLADDRMYAVKRASQRGPVRAVYGVSVARRRRRRGRLVAAPEPADPPAPLQPLQPDRVRRGRLPRRRGLDLRGGGRAVHRHLADRQLRVLELAEPGAHGHLARQPDRLRALEQIGREDLGRTASGSRASRPRWRTSAACRAPRSRPTAGQPRRTRKGDGGGEQGNQGSHG